MFLHDKKLHFLCVTISGYATFASAEKALFNNYQ